jgi:hypothetical protein
MGTGLVCSVGLRRSRIAWSIGDLLDTALATQRIDPVVIAPDRRRAFHVIEGGKT